jgi:hypothetical protein
MVTKFLAPMLFAATTKGLSMAEVLHWLDSREDQEVKDILEAARVPAAVDAWESSQYRTDRAVDSQRSGPTRHRWVMSRWRMTSRGIAHA